MKPFQTNYVVESRSGAHSSGTAYDNFGLKRIPSSVVELQFLREYHYSSCEVNVLSNNNF